MADRPKGVKEVMARVGSTFGNDPQSNGAYFQRQSYYEAKKGYYVPAFSTKISDATKKEQDLATSFGLELVSAYQKIARPLLYLEEKNQESDVDSKLIVYYVHLATATVGKLYILTQVVGTKTNIQYIYKYRTKGDDYKKEMGVVNKGFENKKDRTYGQYISAIRKARSNKKLKETYQED